MILINLSVLGAPGTALGIGSIGFDASSFLKTAENRSTSSTTVFLSPQFSFRGNTIEGAGDAMAHAFLNDSGSFTVDARNLYIATSEDLMPHHQFTLGRREYSWSKGDEAMDLGLWSPRFMWDPLHPEPIGLTGAFYTYSSKYWRLRAFASPISIPERGYPIRGDKGRLQSSSPFFTSPPEAVEVLNRRAGIQYDLKTPPIKDIILRPGAAVSAQFGDEEGPWSQVAYGLMPVHQADLVAEGALDPQAFVFNAQINPRFRHHHMLTGEAGFSQKDWGVWTSLTGESPLAKDTSSSAFFTPMGPSLIFMAGGYAGSEHGLRLSASALRIIENQLPGNTQSLDLALPSRFPYTSAVRLGGRWEFDSPFTLETQYTYDVGKISGLWSTDCQYRPRAQGWLVGLGLDLIHSGSGKGQYGDYQGDDRVRGSLAFSL